MTELGVGEVVRITVIGDSADSVDYFAAALRESPELSGALTAMPHAGEAECQDFGTWQLLQEFIISTASGATSAALTQAIHALWERGHAERQLPAAPSASEEPQGATTPQRKHIVVSVETDGVTEITVHVRGR